MIGRLSGTVILRGRDQVMLDVRGVGYVVQVSERTAAGLPAPGQPAQLWTEMIVREDLMQLFGFPTLAERDWHRLLTGVQGVGARLGLAILGTLGPDALLRAVALGDAAALRRAPGVGPKLAQRVVLELRDKAPAAMAAGAPEAAPVPDPLLDPGDAAAPAPRRRSPAQPAGPAPDAQAAADALSALTRLGYAPAEAAGAIAGAQAADPAAAIQTLIRAALRTLAPPE